MCEYADLYYIELEAADAGPTRSWGDRFVFQFPDVPYSLAYVMFGSNTSETKLHGNLMHCTAPGNIAHNFLRLKEGAIYSVKNFTVQPNKDDFCVLRFDHFIVEMDGDTIVCKSSVNPDGVVRYVTNVGRTTTTRSGSKTLDFHLANNRGQSVRVTLWGGLGEMLIEKRTRHVRLYPIVLTAMSVKLYNSKPILSINFLQLKISSVKEIKELQVAVTQKKPTRRRQTALKKRPQKEKAVDQLCIPWTPEEETALCKGWVRTSKDSVKGNMRKEGGFWIDILKYMHDTCPITQRRTYDMVNRKWKTVRPKVCTFCGVYANAVQMYTSGASDTNYLRRALIDYQAEYGVPFTLLHCWEILKDSEKWNSGELPAFRQEREDGKNKRYKSSGSSSFKTKDSGESINLNTTVESEDENEVEEVEEVRRPKPMGRDQAKRKMKAGSTSSASSFDVAELAKMMASDYVMASDPYNIRKKQEMSELLKIKNRELELKAAELEIRRMENRQRDKALYETTTDEALKETLRQRLFG
nr:hypothetical protein [Tanacetum cinerariifolium]